MPLSADVSFTFDSKPFTNGLAQIEKGLGRLVDQTAQTTRHMGQAVFRGVLKMELLKAAVHMVYSGVQRLGKYMPEVTQVFEASREIILRNLFWPLRQALMPVLQRILDWVRDNRAMFVRWGTTMVSVFRSVVVVAKQLWGLMRGIAESIVPTIAKTLGISGKTASEVVNLILAKVAAVVIWLGYVLRPFGEEIKGLLESLIAGAKELFDGFSTHIPDILGDLKDVWDQVKGIVAELLGGQGTLESIGKLIGTAVDAALKSVAASAKGFKEGIAGAWKNIKNIADNLAGIITDLGTMNERGQSIYTFFEKIWFLIGKIVKWGLEKIDRFIKGFREGVQGAQGPLNDIADALNRIWDTVFGNEEANKRMNNFAEWLGKITGTVILEGLKLLATTLTTIANAIQLMVTEWNKWTGPEGLAKLGWKPAETPAGTFAQGLAQGFEAQKNVARNLVALQLWNMVKPLEDLVNTVANFLFPGRAKKAEDVLIRPSGEVIRFHPQDTIVASKSGFRGMITHNVNMSLTVTEGNARAAGERFGEGLQRGLRRDLLDSLVAGGY